MTAEIPTDAETTAHRLQLPRDTPTEAVLDMVRNVVPDAHLDDGDIVLGEDARLVPDAGARGAGRWTLTTPRVREPVPPDDLPDSHGYARAFPDGIPFARERQLLDLAWSLGRRLYGAVVTDAGERLEPHPFQIRDLTVTSPNALVADDLLELLVTAEPEVAIDAQPIEADTTGYSLTIPLGESGEIAVRVGPTSRPTALLEVPWLDDAVDYAVVHLPADETEDAVALPDPQMSERWAEAYSRVGRIAGLLVETVGGYVVDLEGLLVAPEHLA